MLLRLVLALVLLSAPALAADALTVKRDVAYGVNAAQAMDIYLPQNPVNAPVILMVHGGGWRHGDKTHSNVTTPKAAHYTGLGYIFISTNYRMLPEADVGQQALDVATALAYVQTHAADWGGNPAKIILMGHSAGGHLAALLTASTALQTAAKARPAQALISLDSAGYNIPAMMRMPHLGLYDDAFGGHEDKWKDWSPMHQLSGVTPPMLLVCSTQRFTPCGYAERFAERANKLGGKASVLLQDKTHAEINFMLGADNAYTKDVDAFLKTLN
jgi:arylformamidase